MPVIRTAVGPQGVERFRALWEELAAELAAPKPFGQPMVSVESFPRNGLEGVTVIWDKLAARTDGERSAIIGKAFEQAAGPEWKDKLAFAVGLTVREALDSYLLPYELKGAWISDVNVPDPPTGQGTLDEQLRRATEGLKSRVDRVDARTRMRPILLAAGGTEHVRRANWYLPCFCFQTIDQAEACKQHLEQLTAEFGVTWQLVEHAGGVVDRFEDD